MYTMAIDRLATKPPGSRSDCVSREAGEAQPSGDPRPLQIKLGFIGVGQMGTAMAANLAAAGQRVSAYVRHRDRMEELVALGLEPTTEMAGLSDSDIVISMLPDDTAAMQVDVNPRKLKVSGLPRPRCALRSAAAELDQASLVRSESDSGNSARRLLKNFSC